MKKAIIYNMDPNGTRKMDNDRNSAMSFKSDIISLQSSRSPDSEILSDEHRRSSAANSPYTSRTNTNTPFFEYDFFDCDESPEATTKSEPNLAKRVESFEEKYFFLNISIYLSLQ